MATETYFFLNLINAKLKYFILCLNRISLELKTKFMPKFIFILFLFFCSLHAFSQKALPNTQINETFFSGEFIKIEKKKMKNPQVKNFKEAKIDLLMNGNNLCEILSIKVSDLLNEAMLKNLKANV